MAPRTKKAPRRSAGPRINAIHETRAAEGAIARSQGYAGLSNPIRQRWRIVATKKAPRRSVGLSYQEALCAKGSTPYTKRLRSNTASPFRSVTIASPSMRHERAGRAATAAAASGKRPAKSWPFRVRSRTPAAGNRRPVRTPNDDPSCAARSFRASPICSEFFASDSVSLSSARTRRKTHSP